MFSEKFICAGYDYTTYTSHVPAPYFRKAFEIDGEVKKSVITLTGLGFYELYVNGQRLTKGILAPYISNPDDLVYYDEYDITECLVPGKNVLGIMLGNGMQNAPGGQIWDFDIAAFRGTPKRAYFACSSGCRLISRYSMSTPQTAYGRCSPKLPTGT